MAEQRCFIVTGGAGFIGSNLVAALSRREPAAQILVIDDFRSGSFANIVESCAREGVGAFSGRVLAANANDMDWDSFLGEHRPVAVFHQAAITDTTVSDERRMIDDNAGGFGALMGACVRASVPLVYASSAATYGSPPQGRDGVAFPLEAAGEPNNVYGFSKWLMECEHRRGMEHAGSAGQEPPRVVGLRYFNVFGPGEARKGKMASMVYQLARQMLGGRRPRIFRDGEQARDHVYVRDVVACTLAAAGMDGPARSGVYNVGCGIATSFNQIIDALRSALGIPESELPSEYFDMPGDIAGFYQSYTCADISETERGLRWRPAYRPADAIAEYAAYLKGAVD